MVERKPDPPPVYQCDCGEEFRSHLERVAHMVGCYTQLGNVEIDERYLAKQESRNSGQ